MASDPRQQSRSIIPAERIEKSILLIRGEKVMLDFALAQLYNVTTGRLNEQVHRNSNRFPKDFAFQLTAAELGYRPDCCDFTR